MRSRILVAAIAIIASISIAGSAPAHAKATRSTGEVSVEGNHLICNGQLESTEIRDGVF